MQSSVAKAPDTTGTHVPVPEPGPNLDSKPCLIPLPPNAHPAEVHAAACLKKDAIDSRDVIELTNLLESEVPARGSGTCGKFAFSAGAYVHGGVYGSRLGLTNFPLTTSLLTRYFRKRCPSAHFSSLGLFKDISAQGLIGTTPWDSQTMLLK